MNQSRIILLILLTAFIFQQCTSEKSSPEKSSGKTTEKTMTPQQQDYALVIHGGAGTILKKNMTPEKEKAYLNKLNDALDAGEAVLINGGSAQDAVCAAIMIMEDSPLFNAGKGAVFTHEGKNELDASFMEGKTMNAGAVGGLTNVKNPILAARAVMEKSEHVLLTSKGAEQFSEEQGLEMVDPKYFYTERRWNSLQRAMKAEKVELSEDEAENKKHGTVGAAALDKNGNLAAGTSTGGMTNKRYNRFGDVPIIGAGTYANNQTCAVSCTGHGEFFIRWAVAHDISAMMEYEGVDLKTAGDAVVNEKLVKVGGSGGAITVDKYGNVAMPFNSTGMYRGYLKANGERAVAIFK